MLVTLTAGFFLVYQELFLTLHFSRQLNRSASGTVKKRGAGTKEEVLSYLQVSFMVVPQNRASSDHSVTAT